MKEDREKADAQQKEVEKVDLVDAKQGDEIEQDQKKDPEDKN